MGYWLMWCLIYTLQWHKYALWPFLMSWKESQYSHTVVDFYNPLQWHAKTHLFFVFYWPFNTSWPNDTCICKIGITTQRPYKSVNYLVVVYQTCAAIESHLVQVPLPFPWCLAPVAQMAWWRHEMETFSVLLAICAGNSSVIGEFPTQRPVTRSFDVFFDLCLNKRLSKQSWGWWFETPWRSLRRHCKTDAWHPCHKCAMISKCKYKLVKR